MDRWIDGSMDRCDWVGVLVGERLGRGAERMRLEELLYLESPNLTLVKCGSRMQRNTSRDQLGLKDGSRTVFRGTERTRPNKAEQKQLNAPQAK